MLNWLKRKARVTLHSRYNNILGRSNHSEMILTEQSMVNSQQAQAETVKLYIYNVDGEEYSLDAPPHMTLEKIKMMAVGHFFTPLDAVGRSSVGGSEASQDWCEGISSSNNYRLVLTRGSRTLLDENSVINEELLNNDELVLIECRKNIQNPSVSNSSVQATQERIAQETSHLLPKNQDRLADLQMPPVDFKIALRKILLTMIEASVHLISSEEDCVDIFMNIFEQLERKHRPRVDSNSLKQLTEMGFPEVRAAQALFLKRTVPAAMDWLLDDSNFDINDLGLESVLLSLSPEQRKEYFIGEGKDPAKAVLEQFNIYIKKWFQPEAKGIQFLKNLGYGEDVAKEALRASCNNEIAARSLLEGDSTMVEEIQKGFDKDSSIMVAILESPIVQLALSKPKILFALMVLCENPNNANVWLSDPETHPVVSQVLRIYHAEKHKLYNESDSSFKTVNQAQQSHSASTRTESVFFPLGTADISARQVVHLPGNNREGSDSVNSSPTISMRIESHTPLSSRRRVRRVQTPPGALSFPVTMPVRPPPLEQAAPSSTPEVTHLTLTYIPPTTEGGLPTFSVRLEGSSDESHQSNLDVDMSDETRNPGDMDTQ